MSPIVNNILLTCFVLYLLLIVIDDVSSRSFGRLRKELFGLMAAFLVLHWSTGFPSVRESFSSVPLVSTIAIMFGFVLFGMAANYLFYLRGPFLWRSFLRPLVISPMVLLPLVGTVENRSGVESVQLTCLALLAFQNGFFWRTVFQHARPKVR
jgi:ABC-type Co2+ transport system permease subunit